MSDKRVRPEIWCCLGTVLVVVFLVILPLSFQRVTYYEIALSKNRVSGQVSREDVYKSGNHAVGPNTVFVKYPANVQYMYLEDQSIWSKSAGEAAGTLLALDISLQYQLIPEKLGDLYDKVGMEFDSLTRNLAISSIKNEAVKYTADEYLANRRNIEIEMLNSVKKVLFNESDSDLIGLQLREVTFPNLYYSKKLAAAVQTQNNNAEEYRKESRIIRGETSELVQYIENDAILIRQVADAKSVNIKQTALNTATKIVQEARSDGLKSIVDEININNHKHLLSLDYILQIEKSNKTNFLVNFDKTGSSIII
jgi:regulator of protease activity HflC (stomatin/prohibitin superfamily)